MTRAGVLVTLTACLVSACTAHHPQAARPAPPTATSSVEETPAASVTATADVLEPVLRQRFADSYAGLELDHAKHTVIVWRLPNPDLDAEVRALAPGAKIAFTEARLPIARRSTLAAQITTDQALWAERGVDVVATAVGDASVQVSVKRVTAQTKRAMAQHYGCWAIDVKEVI